MKKEKNLNTIAMLQYQMKRYQATGNGVMCQFLNAKIHKMLKLATL